MSLWDRSNRPPEKRAVLVTGSSSGIGRAIAIHLARQGFTVFAGVRKEKDAEALWSLGEPDLLPLCPLDLTRPDHIQRALECVCIGLAKRGIDGLYAIVNNAGGGAITPVELMDLNGFRAELETRLVGPVALLQAFLPEIRRAGGRVVWIATPGLFPVKYVANIHAADFAVNCLARTLALELKPWNIPVVMVRCGGIKTPAADRGHRELVESFEAWPPERLALYRESLAREQESLEQFDTRRTDPEKVARVVARALTARKPQSRYQVGYLSGAAAVLELMPQIAVDTIMALRG